MLSVIHRQITISSSKCITFYKLSLLIYIIYPEISYLKLRFNQFDLMKNLLKNVFHYKLIIIFYEEMK